MSKKFKEVSQMGKEELAKKLLELKKELIKADAQVATGTVPKNPSSIRNTKRMMARIIMLLGQKKLEEKITQKTIKTVKKKEATK